MKLNIFDKWRGIVFKAKKDGYINILIKYKSGNYCFGIYVPDGISWENEKEAV